MRAWLLAAAVAMAAAPAWAAPLVDAARTGDRDAALGEIAAGADVDAADAGGATALLYAAHRQDADLVAALLAGGGDPSRANDFGATPMSEAAALGDAAVIELLLEAGADPDSPSPEGQTALMAVARTGRLDAAGLLIDAGADVNARESWSGQTALMWAAAQSQPEMIELLLRRGADPDAQAIVRDWERRVTSEPRIKEMFSGGLTPLLYAARTGCVACARALVEGGADIDKTDPDGVTPVIVALLNFNYDTAAYLVEAGASPNAFDWWGRTPLYAAIDMAHIPDSARVDVPTLDRTTGLEVAEMLLARGANPNFQLKHYPLPRNIVFGRNVDNFALNTGTTPLVRAAYGADVDATRLMLAQPDVRVNLANVNGVTPILAAAGPGGTRGSNKSEADVIETLRLLIEAGGDIDAQDRGGQSALHKAARLGSNEVIRFLGESGADLDAADSEGLTPYDYAAGRKGVIAFGSFDPGVERPETMALLEELAAERAAAGGAL